jgi:hypothetical protein
MMFDLRQANFFASSSLRSPILFSKRLLTVRGAFVKEEKENRRENKTGQPCLNMRLFSIRFVTI